MNAVSALMNNFDWSILLGIILRTVAVLICLSIHELSHGFVAYKLGDPTAKSMGRISINPLHHLDLFGTLMMIIVGFGWAKPVPVDMRYFKRPKSGMAITALAGPLSNFLLAFVTLVILAVLPLLSANELIYNDVNYFNMMISSENGTLFPLIKFLWMMASLSIGLGIINLIPIPPLDGSKVLFSILSDELYYKVLKYERYGMIVLIAGLYLGWFDAPLFAACNAVFDTIWAAASFFPNLIAG